VDWSRFAKLKIFLPDHPQRRGVRGRGEGHRGRPTRTPPAADTICYATKENQEAARELAADPEVQLVFVIGGKHSANTRHLHDICARYKPSHLVQGAEDIDPAWLPGVTCIGLTAGASTPDYVIDEVENRLTSISSGSA